MSDFLEDEMVKEALENANRAIGSIHALHLGPLDYNVTQAVDYLRGAAGALEAFLRKRERDTPAGC